MYRSSIFQAKSCNKSSFSQFLEDFQCFISSVATVSHDFLITGDFNIHVNNLSDLYSQQLLFILSHVNLDMYVSFPTHCYHHTVDVSSLLTQLFLLSSLILLTLHLIIFLSFHHPTSRLLNHLHHPSTHFAPSNPSIISISCWTIFH